MDSNSWEQVGILDRPTRMRVGCNIGCTYENMYNTVGELAEIDLLVGSVMRTAVLEDIVSCLLAFANSSGMKTGYCTFNCIGELIK